MLDSPCDPTEIVVRFPPGATIAEGTPAASRSIVVACPFTSVTETT
jgi:hypothetical protein